MGSSNLTSHLPLPPYTFPQCCGEYNDKSPSFYLAILSTLAITRSSFTAQISLQESISFDQVTILRIL